MNDIETEKQQARGALQFLREVQQLRTKPVPSYESFTHGDPGWAMFVDAFAVSDHVHAPLLAGEIDTDEAVVVTASARSSVSPPIRADVAENVERGVDDPYARLFEIKNLMESSPGTYELLMCVGLVQGVVNGRTVERHLVVVPAEIDHRADGVGELALVVAGSCRVEDDFVETAMITEPIEYLRTRALINNLDGSSIMDPASKTLVQSLITRASPNAAMHDARTSSPGDMLHVSMSPMVLFRPRRPVALVDFLDAAIVELDQNEFAPEGLRRVVEERRVPSAGSGDGESAPGLSDMGDAVLASLPLNDVQTRVVAEASTGAQTVVQGASGTGKTHTSAALAAHLLSIGRRVLITAPTDQAVSSIYDLLPVGLRDLAARSIGSGRRELDVLTASIEAIADRMDAVDLDSVEADEARVAARIESLRRDRRRHLAAELAKRHHEDHEIEICGVARTRHGHHRWLDEQSAHGWLRDRPSVDTPPLDDRQFGGMIEVFNDAQLGEQMSEATSVVGVRLCSADEFAASVAVEASPEGQQVLQELLDLAGDASHLWQAQLADAVRSRSVEAYAAVVGRVGWLRFVKAEHALAMDRLEQLRIAAPDTAAAIERGETFAGRSLERAWMHARTRMVLDDAVEGVASEVVAEFDRLIGDCHRERAEARAWAHALRRIESQPDTRARLIECAQLTKPLGERGTDHADTFGIEARNALNRVRSSMPVQVMSLHRVWEQLDPAQDRFDVVIVDDASQVGLEALVLQTLAPQMVVLGDDSTIGPVPDGIDQYELDALVERFVPTERGLSGWGLAGRSLFDEAKERFGEVITLSEYPASESSAPSDDVIDLTDEPVTRWTLAAMVPVLKPPPIPVGAVPMAESTPAASAPPTAPSPFAPYVEWAARSIPEIADIAREELAQLVLEVVEVEGPMSVNRLHQVLHQASGGTEITAPVRLAINEAMELEDGVGLVVRRSPNAGLGGGWLRTASQPNVLLRARGDRAFAQIPLPELVEALRCMGALVHDDDEALFRSVLEEYGIPRLTDGRRARLEKALGILQR